MPIDFVSCCMLHFCLVTNRFQDNTVVHVFDSNTCNTHLLCDESEILLLLFQLYFLGKSNVVWTIHILCVFGRIISVTIFVFGRILKSSYSVQLVLRYARKMLWTVGNGQSLGCYVVVIGFKIPCNKVFESLYYKNRKRLSVPWSAHNRRLPLLSSALWQQAASHASTDTAWRHPVWLPHSSLGFQRPVGRRMHCAALLRLSACMSECIYHIYLCVYVCIYFECVELDVGMVTSCT